VLEAVDNWLARCAVILKATILGQAWKPPQESGHLALGLVAQGHQDQGVQHRLQG